MAFTFSKYAGGLVLLDDVLQDDDVAGLGDGEVGLGGDDHAEGLQCGGDADIVLGAGGKNFAEVLGAAVGRDGPQDVGEVLLAEAVGGGEAGELCFDGDAAALTGDLGFALARRAEAACPQTRWWWSRCGGDS